MKTKHDARFNVWICEAKFSCGNWFPMPSWGADNKRRNALSRAMEYFRQNGMTWTMNKTQTKHSCRIRFRNYRKI